MNFHKLNKIRSILRKLKIIDLYSYFFSKKEKQQINEYLKNPKPIFDFTFGNNLIKMNTSSLSEYMRVISYKKDFKILTSLLESLQNRKCFWDVGTNIGLYSIIVARNYPTCKVFSFEPEIESFNRLRENIKLNILNNITPLNYALGDKEEKVQLTKAAHFSNGNHSILNPNKIEAGTTYQEITVHRGENIISKENVEIPNIIKIDVEGFEFNVLKGLHNILSSKDCVGIICEVHFRILEANGKADEPEKIIDFLKGKGFVKIKWLDHSHFLATKN